MPGRLSKKQIEIINRLLGQGKSDNQIGLIVGCTANAVGVRRRAMGLPPNKPEPKSRSKAKCRTCYYMDLSASCCTYILFTGRRRGCAGGDECNKWRPKKGKVGDVRKRYQHRTEGSVCNSELSQSVNDAWNADMRNMEVQGVPESETCQRCKWYGEETGICCNGEADAFMDDVEPDDGCGWYDDGSQNALNGL